MNFKKHVRRDGAQVNAGSMADIAFLLLIFFLVTTTILIDKGIAVKLPPFTYEEPDCVLISNRNVLRVLVNGNNELLVEGEPALISNLKNTTIEFITNPKKLETLARNPKIAIISLQNDRSTKYKTYISVYNELKAAYNEIWNEAAQEQFGFYYKDLDAKQKRAIQEDFPLIISEAEPTDLIGQK